MKIGLDVMGGDYAPGEVLKGVRQYLHETKSPATLFLIGDQTAIEAGFTNEVGREHIQIIHASQVIDMHESPIKALKEKTQSSIAIGFQLLSTEKIDAFISAGNTGAMMVGTMYSLKTIEGITRPTISSIMPRDDGSTGIFLDVGLNSDCKPDQLNQFATIGTIYAQQMLGIEKPRVGLINIGEEEGKGNLLAQAAYPLLKDNQGIHFIGNIEGRDIMENKVDVMICDGFTGNVILKMAESIYDIFTRNKVMSDYLNRFNFELQGGTPVLGVTKPVIIGHGISHDTAFKNMIHLAQKMIETKVLTKMAAAFT